MSRVMLPLGAVLFGALSLFLIWFGYVYATADDLLSFHAAAVPPGALAAIKPLYGALMNLIGGASVALGGLGLVLSVGPIRHGKRWAALSLAGANVIALVMAAITAEELANVTGAPTSWHIMGGLLAATAVALTASLVGAATAFRQG